jgi:Uma2 family endonuclease
MSSAKPKILMEINYEAAAQEYLRSLPLEHFMETTDQATQRQITLESLAVLKVHRPEVQVFNELLVQYPRPGERKPGQVVPDNMVVLSNEPVRARSSFNLPLEKAKPFWVLEYVSKSNRRKDYDDNFDKYEKELKVPYFLLFYPDSQDLTLYRHTGKKYVSVKPNKHGCYAIPELDLEIGLLDAWVRYRYKGELLPLPADLHRDLAAMKLAVEREKKRADDLENRLARTERELAELRALVRQHPLRRNNNSKSKS